VTDLPAIRNPDRELIGRVAMDVGKQLVAHIEVMYPAVFAAMNSGALLSVRNHVHNDIMAALDTIDAVEIEARLARRAKQRREWLKQWRAIRAMGNIDGDGE
jgi:hypothetical protein